MPNAWPLKPTISAADRGGGVRKRFTARPGKAAMRLASGSAPANSSGACCCAQSRRGYDIAYSVGEVAFDPLQPASIAGLLAQADAAMYADKQASRAARA